MASSGSVLTDAKIAARNAGYRLDWLDQLQARRPDMNGAAFETPPDQSPNRRAVRIPVRPPSFASVST